MTNIETTVFVGHTCGPDEYACFFEATAGNEETPAGGFLYVTDRKANRIVRHLKIYSNPNLGLNEGDVQIFWSSDETKCGVSIWGRMRGIIDLASGSALVVTIDNPSSSGIIDLDWLKGFDAFLDHYTFIHARQRYWRQVVKEHEPDRQRLPEPQTSVETNFISSAAEPGGMFAVFEDDGVTGYLYAYNAEADRVLRHVHVYDRSPQVNVKPEDVQVQWNQDGGKCGVSIWGRMRAIIDVDKGKEGRVWLQNRETPGIDDPEWLGGF